MTTRYIMRPWDSAPFPFHPDDVNQSGPEDALPDRDFYDSLEDAWKARAALLQTSIQRAEASLSSLRTELHAAQTIIRRIAENEETV